MNKLPLLSDKQQMSEENFEVLESNLKRLVDFIIFKIYRKKSKKNGSDVPKQITKTFRYLAQSLKFKSDKLLLVNKKILALEHEEKPSMLKKILATLIVSLTNSNFLSVILGSAAISTGAYAGHRIYERHLTEEEIEGWGKYGVGWFPMFKEIISKVEAPSYTSSWNGWAGNQNFSNLTVNQILDIQDAALHSNYTLTGRLDKYNRPEHSSAYGKYQITRTTLKDLRDSGVISILNEKLTGKKESGGNAKFSNALQDEIGKYLLMKRAGFEQFIEGQINTAQFLSKAHGVWEGIKINDLFRKWAETMKAAAIRQKKGVKTLNEIPKKKLDNLYIGDSKSSPKSVLNFIKSNKPEYYSDKRVFLNTGIQFDKKDKKSVIDELQYLTSSGVREIYIQSLPEEYKEENLFLKEVSNKYGVKYIESPFTSPVTSTQNIKKKSNYLSDEHKPLLKDNKEMKLSFNLLHNKKDIPNAKIVQENIDIHERIVYIDV